MSQSLPPTDPWDALQAAINGPPGKPQAGLLWITTQNTEAIQGLLKTAAKHSLSLYGNGGEGLTDQVRAHERVIARAGKTLSWAVGLIAAESIGVLGYLLWWAIRTVPQ